jgi:hypothetical protein
VVNAKRPSPIAAARPATHRQRKDERPKERESRPLGQTSTTVTERHYVNRKPVVPDYRAATERLAPGSESDPGAAPVK